MGLFFYAMMKDKIIIQGALGCFHEEAALKYFGRKSQEFIPSDSFAQLAHTLKNRSSEAVAIMAIENSIAGTILQNYRILREYQFNVVGEVYLRIRHNLMALPGQAKSDITEVHSHPMALNQCLHYLSDKKMKMVESNDTALSAKRIREQHLLGQAAIASMRAAEIYDLEILDEGIETSKINYTRFFILNGAEHTIEKVPFNKASIYLTVVDAKGRLLSVLEVISHHEINMTKLQSYPILGELKKYYFHLDLEFDEEKQFYDGMKALKSVTESLEILGMYQKAEVDD